MRSNAAEFDLVAPPTLRAVLDALEEGRIPLAGGTELMVALGAARLAQRPFVSLQHCRELRFVESDDEDTIRIGAGTTFADIRGNAAIARDLPLLVRTASWTGSLANQNRGTLGGNIANASPAADTPPALLAYDASLELLSREGLRTLPYREFHLGYKRTALARGELIYAIRVPRRFSAHVQWVRKVGTRNAQAISKTALAAVALLENGVLAEIALGAASLLDRPARLRATEAALLGRDPSDPAVRLQVCASLAREAAPIDDIRSTARYRSRVAANLLCEFLDTCAAAGETLPSR